MNPIHLPFDDPDRLTMQGIPLRPDPFQYQPVPIYFSPTEPVWTAPVNSEEVHGVGRDYDESGGNVTIPSSMVHSDRSGSAPQSQSSTLTLTSNSLLWPDSINTYMTNINTTNDTLTMQHPPPLDPSLYAQVTNPHVYLPYNPYSFTYPAAFPSPIPVQSTPSQISLMISPDTLSGDDNDGLGIGGQVGRNPSDFGGGTAGTGSSGGGGGNWFFPNTLAPSHSQIHPQSQSQTQRTNQFQFHSEIGQESHSSPDFYPEESTNPSGSSTRLISHRRNGDDEEEEDEEEKGRRGRRKASGSGSGLKELKRGKKSKPISPRITTTLPHLTTTTTTSSSSLNKTPASLPTSIFDLPSPPRPFSFSDLGLTPPLPFQEFLPGDEDEDEDGEGDGGSQGDDDDDDGGDAEGEFDLDLGVGVGMGQGKRTGKKGEKRKGKRKEMNRVAAKRHREKNKERLKALEDRRTWLNKAVGEYEKSNKKLRDTLDRLQRENVMLRGTA